MGFAADEQHLLRQHADVLFRMDERGRLTSLNEPGDEPAPRLFLARSRDTHATWFRADVPAEAVDTCRSIAIRMPAWDGSPSPPAAFEELRSVIAASGPIDDETVGPAFVFGERVIVPDEDEVLIIDAESAHLLERHFPYTLSVLESRDPVVGVVLDGAVVSACFAARSTHAACEAGVATVEQYRGRGLAPIVVSAWRGAVERGGRQPLYSTSWENAASRAVARRLRLVAYAETFSLT